MENLSKTYIIEIKEELLHLTFNDNGNYAHQKTGEIIEKMQSKVSHYFNISPKEYAENPITRNLHHGERMYSDLYWRRENEKDSFEYLNWVLDSYLQGLDILLTKIKILFKRDIN